MLYLFIDTNIWLSLFHLSDNDIEQFPKLEEALSDNINLLLPEQVVDEYYRNRDAKIADALNKFKLERFQTPNVFKQHKDYDELSRLFSIFSNKHEEIKNSVIQDIREQNTKIDAVISEFFKTVAKVSDDLIMKAKNRVIKGNPPGTKNSYGDAINWEFLLEKVPENEDLFIITDNEDYYSKLTKRVEPNLFLKKEWKTKKKSDVFVYRSLASFLNKYFSELVLSDENIKDNLIQSLDLSSSLGNVIWVISQLEKFTDWTDEQINRLCLIGRENREVLFSFVSEDVQNFYSNLLDGYTRKNEDIEFVNKILNKGLSSVITGKISDKYISMDIDFEEDPWGDSTWEEL